MKKTLLSILITVLTVSLAFLVFTGCEQQGGGKTEQIVGETGIVLSGGGFSEGAVLKVEPIDMNGGDGKELLEIIKEEKYDNEKPVYAWDLSVLKDGVKVQPSGKVRVSIPTNGIDFTDYEVLHITDDGKIERLTATVEKGNVVFETESFSKFVLVARKTLPSHTHTFSEEWSKDETYHWHAATCEHTDEVSGKGEHSWNDGEITIPATATENGIKTYVCLVCKATKDESYTETPHTHTFSDEWSKDETYHWYAATCEHTDEVSGKGEHSWNDGEITTPATTTESGLKTYTCTVCKATKEEVYIETPHIHTFSDEWSKDETYHWYAATCEHPDEISKKGEHSWGDPWVERLPSDIQGGLTHRSCTVCRMIKSETTPHEHTYYSGWQYNSDSHWQIANCGKVCDGLRGPKTAHEYENGVCKYCEIKDQSIPSQGLLYTLQDDGTYFVTGIGDCTDVHIVIPETYEGKPVSGIGNKAFQYNYKLLSLYLSDNVKHIGDYAFDSCNKMMSVRLPDEMTYIGEYAFNCNRFWTLTLPTKGITEIKKFAFAYNSRLVELYIPDNIKVIGEGAFIECRNVTELRLPEKLNSLGARAFSCLKISSLTIPEGLSELPESVFKGCVDLESIYIPDGVEIIGDYAFSQCTNATELRLPESLTAIGGCAFQYLDNITSVVIPSKITTLSNELFYYCKNLEQVVIPETVESIGISAFAYCGKLKSVDLPSGLTSLGGSAFYQTGLKSIVIPEKITVLEKSVFGQCRELSSVTFPSGLVKIGMYAFSECTSLKEVVIPDGVKEILNNAFEYCSLEKFNIPTGVTEIASGVFIGLKVKSLTIPGRITCIKGAAFVSSQFETLVIESGVTYIGYAAFEHCRNLVNVTIPSTVQIVEQDAFSDCNNIKYAEYDNAYYLGNKDNPYHVVLKVKDNNAKTCDLHDDAHVIAAYAFHGAAIESIVIHDGIKFICDGAFMFSQLKQVHMATINDWYFSHDSSKIDTENYSLCGSDSAPNYYWVGTSATAETRAGQIKAYSTFFRK